MGERVYGIVKGKIMHKSTPPTSLLPHPLISPPLLPLLPSPPLPPSITSSLVNRTPSTTHWYSPMSSSCTFRTRRLPLVVITCLSEGGRGEELNSQETGIPGGSVSLHSNSMFWCSRARIVVKFSAVTLSTVTLYKSVDWSGEGGSHPVTDHVSHAR